MSTRRIVIQITLTPDDYCPEVFAHFTAIAARKRAERVRRMLEDQLINSSRQSALSSLPSLAAPAADAQTGSVTRFSPMSSQCPELSATPDLRLPWSDLDGLDTGSVTVATS